MTMDETLHALAKQLADCMTAKKMKLAVAESCTGGFLAKVITDVAGSSAWFDSSVVTYSNEAKKNFLGVSEVTLQNFGAVSRETVLEMCEGVFNNTSADVALSISGVAGPDGGTDEKPVGLVWLCWGKRDKTAFAFTFNFSGDRDAVRSQAVEEALNSLLDLLKCPEA